MDTEKAPEPKEIPDKFRDDGPLREAYLAGWSDCGAAVMAAKPEDDTVGVLDPLYVHSSLPRRVDALEGQFRALSGDTHDQALQLLAFDKALKALQKWSEEFSRSGHQ